MFRKFLLLAICASSFTLKAQEVYRETEYGFGAGGTQYYGDLNQSQQINYLRWNATAFVKKNINNYVALEIAAMHGLMGGSDKLNKNTFQKLRNLSFETRFTEISANAEFNFLRYSLGDFDHRFTPYINLGVGVFRYNPYAYLSGKQYYLKPLGTEGQNYAQYKDRVYSNYALSLPVGIGFKFWVSRGVTFNFELCNRFTSTDYIDDVSTTYIGANLFPIPEPAPPYPVPALQLQDRSTELGAAPLGVAGRQRGISSTRDQFLTGFIGLSFRLLDYRCPRQ